MLFSFVESFPFAGKKKGNIKNSIIMKQTIPVIGMACSACSANIEKKLNTLKGVNSASVSLPGRSALIDFNPQVISLEKMKAEINALGYDLVIDKETSVDEIEKREYVLLKRKTALSWLFSIAVMCVSMRWIDLGSRDIANQVALLIALASMLYCGRQFYVSRLDSCVMAVQTWIHWWLCLRVLPFFSVRLTRFGETLYGQVGELYGTPTLMLR